MNYNGFTLVELMVAIGIIGLLTVISMPAVDKYRHSAVRSATHQEAKNLITSFKNCLSIEDDFDHCATKNIGGMLKAEPQDKTESLKGVECIDINEEEGGQIKIEPKDKERKKERCYFQKHGVNVCLFSVKGTGGHISYHCIDYNHESGSVRETSSDKQGKKLNEDLKVCHEGKCQSI